MSGLRRSSVVLIVIGLLLLVLSAVTRFAITPALSKLPTDVDTTATYSGTATMLNSAAMASGDLANAVAKDVPITLDQRVQVTGEQEGLAITERSSLLKGPGGLQKPSSITYAIDRTTMEATDQPPSGSGATAASGLIFTLPLHPKPQNYSFYVPDLQAAAPLTYLGEGTVNDRDVLRYEVNASGALQNQDTLKSLPPALPKALIAGLVATLPAEQGQAISAALPTLPDTVPLAYTASSKIVLDADATTGAPLNSSIDQQILATVMVNGQAVPLLPVLAVKANLTPDSVAAAVTKAESAAQKLTLLSVVVPLVLLVLGVIAIAIGVLRSRKPADDATDDTTASATKELVND
ncbi:porin PorA family protein [Gordonia sp. VNQ95]|jgi:hypothetical protein|uniref:porin PorA family protein n=1 Tax=Gordonia sp. VNQ95 TaxID=3156619 RepID=UPI0032B5877B